MQRFNSFDDLSDRLMMMSVRIGRVVDALPETRLGRHVAGQLVRCGTSSGPNYEEGRAAESLKDFVHKLKVALKELRETRYWLRLISATEMLPEQRLSELVDECDQLIRILAKSLVTVRNRTTPDTPPLTTDN